MAALAYQATTALTRSDPLRIPLVTLPPFGVGQKFTSWIGTFSRLTVTWDSALNPLLVNANGKVSGVVTDRNNAAVPRARVSLYTRPTGALIRSVYTDANGQYSINGLDPLAVQSYFALAFHPTPDSGYNMTALDLLTPVVG